MAKGQDTGNHPKRQVSRSVFTGHQYSLPGDINKGWREQLMDDDISNSELMNEYHVDEVVGRRNGVDFEDPYTGETVSDY
jgi:hypothetical protein